VSSNRSFFGCAAEDTAVPFDEALAGGAALLTGAVVALSTAGPSTTDAGAI
jgi:hypothetical protein